MIFQSEKPIIQIAYAVEDVRQAAQIWSEKFNVGPFYVNEHIPLANSYVRGTPEPFDHSSAYGWKENLMIELICDHAQKLSPSKVSPEKPFSGIHHVAWIAPNFEAECHALENQDCVQVLWAQNGSDTGMKLAWFDPQNGMNHFYEIYEDTDDIREFYAFLSGKAKNWDGRNPVRDMSG
ncbi:MAG: hypothetical protein DBW69_06455 [PS1 clade bacterium]|uniref:VOC family protein n=1 Tax=PS1 clade bacterium TaxID=2175152 RepID=A0A368DVV8_9PROT|nr:MAG: hypothetical protein DBW69_06455 [PS1 clade bacterium]